MTKVAIYNEFVHEREEEKIKEIYPEGIHMAIKSFLDDDEYEVVTTTLDDHEQVLTPEFLKTVDVLLWWGHMAHSKVSDKVASDVRDAVHEGMGFIALHSGHHSKPFKLLMGTPCNLSWREHGDKERVWVIDPSHPIAQGIDRYFIVEHEEMYGEPFSIPEPDKLVFIGSYEGGEVFRSGCCYQRGNGRIFYFQPGHESYPTYYNPSVQRVIKNAIAWAKPTYRQPIPCPQVEKLND